MRPPLCLCPAAPDSPLCAFREVAEAVTGPSKAHVGKAAPAVVRRREAPPVRLPLALGHSGDGVES